MKRAFSLVISILLLASVLRSSFNTQNVKANGTICIRADGSIDPPTARISTADNVTYTLTGNVSDSIVIERDSIVVDGAGYMVQGTGANYSRGIDLSGRSNVTIKNTQIRAFWRGIWLDGSSNNNISGNTITNNSGNGIFLRTLGPSSSYNSIVGNNITNNGGHGIYLYVFYWSSSWNNSIVGNNITNNGGHGIYLYACFNADASYNSLVGNNITNNSGNGIYLDASDDASSSFNSIVENNITNNGGSGISTNPVRGSCCSCNNILRNNITGNSGSGINLDIYSEYVSSSSSYNSIVENNITNNSGDGISLEAGFPVTSSSQNNSIVGNKITNNSKGIYLSASSYNSIVGNNIINNVDGIYLYSYGVWSSSSYNSIVGNKITNNTYRGITLYASDIGASLFNNSIVENKITNNDYGIDIYHWSVVPPIFVYHNDFVNNTHQGYTSGYRNIWDDGYPSGGNYWSNYAGVDFCSGPYQNETGSDGMGDTPYVIDANNQDNYPLMIPWSGVHDVAVTSVTTCKDGCKPFPTVGQNWTIHINVTVENRGDSAETFNTNVYANATLINQTLLTMPNATSTVLTIKWNATLPYGNYTISAYAEPVEGEISTGDNNCTEGIVYLGTPGDINVDGVVEMMDFFYASNAFLSRPGKPNWNPNADINDDGVVEMMDFYIMSQHYNEHI